MIAKRCKRKMPFTGLVYLLLIVCCCGCTRAYYLNPFGATGLYHHAVPLQSDTFHKATYAGGNLSIGGSNELYRDEVFMLQGILYRSLSFSSFNAYYGISLSLGNYRVEPYDSKGSTGMDTGYINTRAGNKFIGGYGIDAGISSVLPFARGGEWRVIGLETSMHNEFGQYSQFRKKMPFTAANIIDRNSMLVTIGLTTDIVFRVRKRSSMGFKFALGRALFTRKDFWAGNDIISPSGSYLDIPSYSYFTQTTHFTVKKCTGFFQVSFSTMAMSLQAGLSYRLPGK